MPGSKKAMGRPVERQLPPRIDATPEEIAHVVLNAGRLKGPVKGLDYFCRDCKRQVAYPETLCNDNRCEQRHRTVA